MRSSQSQLNHQPLSESEDAAQKKSSTSSKKGTQGETKDQERPQESDVTENKKFRNTQEHGPARNHTIAVAAVAATSIVVAQPVCMSIKPCVSDGDIQLAASGPTPRRDSCHILIKVNDDDNAHDATISGDSIDITQDRRQI